MGGDRTGHYRRWTDEDDAVIRRLVRDGVRPDLLDFFAADELGRTPAACKQRRLILGLRVRPQPWHPLEDAVIREGAELGLSSGCMAREVFDDTRTPDAIATRLRRLGGHPHGHHVRLRVPAGAEWRERVERWRTMLQSARAEDAAKLEERKRTRWHPRKPQGH